MQGLGGEECKTKNKQERLIHHNCCYFNYRFV